MHLMIGTPILSMQLLQDYLYKNLLTLFEEYAPRAEALCINIDSVNLRKIQYKVNPEYYKLI